MKERPLNPSETAPERKLEILSVEEHVALARELSQNPEGFPFKGLDDASYQKIKAEDEEYPGFTTPIDEIMKRCDAVGIKVALEKDPKNLNVYILPLDSDDLVNDKVMPGHLKVSDDMDPRLKAVILYDKAKINARQEKKPA